MPPTAGSLWGMRWRGWGLPEGLLEEGMKQKFAAVLPSSDTGFLVGKDVAW